MIPSTFSRDETSPSAQSVPPISFVDRPEDLEMLCGSLNQCALKNPHFFITMDTEFIRQSTYFPQLSLIQIGLSGHAYVVDFTAFKQAQLAPLVEVLRSPLIVKVFHSASQDCEALYHALNCFPFPLFDTQIAAAFLGMGGCVGYESLVHNCLGIHVDKTCQRSPWLKRPLTEKQISYAAYDVIYLVDVYQILIERLNEAHRTGWVASESLQLLDHAVYEVDATTLWRKFPFTPKQWREAFAMKYLLAWRETKAIDLDKSRPFVLRDQVLFELVFDPNLFKKSVKELLTQPQYKQAHSPFFSVKAWEKHRLFASMKRVLKQIHQELKDLKPDDITAFQEEIRQSGKFNHGQNTTWNEGYRHLKKICRRCAEQNAVSIAMFYAQRDLDLLLEGGIQTGSPWLTPSRLSRGWRKELLKPYQEDLEATFKRCQNLPPKKKKSSKKKTRRRSKKSAHPPKSSDIPAST